MDSAVWEDNLRFKAWMYILLEASYADRTKYHRGNLIQLKRGDCFTTLRTMAKTVGCDPKTAKRILEQFRDDGMITFRTKDHEKALSEMDVTGCPSKEEGMTTVVSAPS